jgi:hypothetical protein
VLIGKELTKFRNPFLPQRLSGRLVCRHRSTQLAAAAAVLRLPRSTMASRQAPALTNASFSAHRQPRPLLAQPTSPYLAHTAAIGHHGGDSCQHTAPRHPTRTTGTKTKSHPDHTISTDMLPASPNQRCAMSCMHWLSWRCPHRPRVPTDIPTGRSRPDHPEPHAYLRVAYCPR